MSSIVFSHVEPLCNVDGFDAGRRTERPCVDDEFVCAHAVVVGEKNRIVLAQPLGHVVGIENGQLRRLLQAIVA